MVGEALCLCTYWPNVVLSIRVSRLKSLCVYARLVAVLRTRCALCQSTPLKSALHIQGVKPWRGRSDPMKVSTDVNNTLVV